MEERKYTLTGFGVKAVFRVEDTEGSDLEYENIDLPDVPLMEKAEESSSNILSEIIDSLVIIYHLTQAF